MYLLNGKKIKMHLAFTGPDGTFYPPYWFNDAEKRNLAGVIEVPDPVYPDPELYTFVENEDGSLTITERTPEDIAAIKASKIPQEVSRLQARIALYNSGLLAQIEEYMSLPETPFITKLAWNEALVFRRDSPLVSQLAALIGLTSDQLDELFVTASQIIV